MPDTAREYLIVGVTGTQGRAVARHLLAGGARVRGLTRNPSSKSAIALAAAGVTLCQGDLDDAAAVESAMRGVDGVYLVTDFFQNGIPGEIRHGKLVADLAAKAKVGHLVHSSVSGAEERTGVPHFDSKFEIEAHVRSLGVPTTILRPVVFMEDLTERQYVPPASWGMMPKLVGRDRPVKWVSVEDIGAVAAAVFSRRDEFVGRDVPIVGDVKSISEAKEIFRKVDGRTPFALPVPNFLFRRFVSEDLFLMWEWLATHEMKGSPAETRALAPSSKDLEAWLRARRARG